MYHELVSSLTGMVPLTDDLLIAFQQRLKNIRIPKGKLLLAEGEVCDKLWYVQSGLVRGFYTAGRTCSDARDMTSWFAGEGDFFQSADSFFSLSPSRECIETLEPCRLICIARSDLHQLYAEYPQLCCFGRIVAERSCLAHLELLRDMRMLSASDRLESFRTRSRELFLRVPQKHIASYLGISENYLSKLKAKP